MDALTCLLGVTARKSLSLNCISHSPNATLLLNVTKHFMWTFKTLWSWWIRSCRRMRLIWSRPLSCENSHLWEMTASLFFFFFSWWKGQREMHHVPVTPPDPSGYSWKLICIPRCDQKPSGRRGGGAGRREDSLKIRKYHQPHRGDVSQGTLTGRQLNWLWQLLYLIKLHFAAQCHRTQKHNNPARLETEQNRETSKPNYLILGTIQSLLELTGTSMKEK